LTVKCGVPHATLPLPIGLEATDQFILELRKYNGGYVPQEITDERGRLIDLITDMHQYFYNKTAALWGDPGPAGQSQPIAADRRYPAAIRRHRHPGQKVPETHGPRPGRPQVGSRSPAGAGRRSVPDAPVDQEREGGPADRQYLRKYISRDGGIPLVRHGFPILDRVGHQFFPTVGYRGAIRLLEQILDALLQRQDDECPEEQFELTM
jgi:nitrogenase molybdenum-iron protein beta chain